MPAPVKHKTSYQGKQASNYVPIDSGSTFMDNPLEKVVTLEVAFPEASKHAAPI